MARYGVLTGVALVFALVCGCETTEQRQQMEFRVTKAEGERDSIAKRLAAEQAKGLALEQRIDGEQVQWSADRAELARLRAHARTLEQTNKELQDELQRRLTRPVERPTIAASPLPDDVDQALQTWAQRFTGRVWYERGRGAVSFANDQLFELGGDTVRSDALPALQDLAGILATIPAQYEIAVVGHTDDVPITKPETLTRHPSNWHLSVHRAIAVKDVFVKAGVAASRLGVMGYGEQRPISDDRAKNRRVEVFIVPKGAVQSLEPVRSQSR